MFEFEQLCNENLSHYSEYEKAIESDFETYNNGEAFFFTQKMADEYIKMATGKCIEEIKALQNGSSTIDEMEWAWDKNPPKQSVFQRLKNKLTK